MAVRSKYNSSKSKRSFPGELVFWVVLLGLDTVFMYLIHRSFGQWYNYQDTMPIMLPVGAFIPLAAVVLRYFPKNTAARATRRIPTTWRRSPSTASTAATWKTTRSARS